MTPHPSGPRPLIALMRRLGERRALVLLAGTATLADLGIVATFAAGLLPLFPAILAHLAVSGAVCAILLPVLTDRRVAIQVGLWIGLMGPFGSVAATVSAVVSLASKPAPADEAWYARLAGGDGDEPDGGLVAALRDGRAYHPSGGQTRSFRDVMAEGSVAEKQVMLGLIAQAYEPAFRDLLMTALNGHEVAVRASAAAVLARLRDRQAVELKRADRLAASSERDDQLAAADIFARAARSGLLPDRDGETLAERASSLRQPPAAAGIIPMAAHARMRGQAPRRDPAGNGVWTEAS